MTGTAGGLNPLDEHAIEELVTQATQRSLTLKTSMN